MPAQDELFLPGIAGALMPRNYRESIYVYLLRLWRWSAAEAIDPTPYLDGSMHAFDDDYDESLALAASLGFSTTNASVAQSAALLVHDRGFNAWRIGTSHPLHS